MRGPFDVGDRVNLLTPSLSQSIDATLQFRRPNSYMPSTPSFIPSSSLLNPNVKDGSWQELYMICGGTGITPMLQASFFFNCILFSLY